MKLSIISKRIELSNKQKKYIDKKVSSVEKYLPRAWRAAARAEVRLDEEWIKQLRSLQAEVTFSLPGRVLIVSHKAENVGAAIDGVKNKLKLEVAKYKDKRTNPKLRRRLIARYRSGMMA